MKPCTVSIILIAILMFSCTGPAEKYKGQITFSEQLEVYTPIKAKGINNPFIADNPKIYTLLNISCSTCLLKLKKWDAFQEELKGTEVSVIPICYSKDDFELLKYLCESNKLGNLQLSLYLDVNEQFMEQNKTLMSESGELTVLANSEDEVVLTGSPIEDPEIKQKYLEEIKKYSPN